MPLHFIDLAARVERHSQVPVKLHGVVADDPIAHFSGPRQITLLVIKEGHYGRIFELPFQILIGMGAFEQLFQPGQELSDRCQLATANQDVAPQKIEIEIVRKLADQAICVRQSVELSVLYVSEQYGQRRSGLYPRMGRLIGRPGQLRHTALLVRVHPEKPGHESHGRRTAACVVVEKANGQVGVGHGGVRLVGPVDQPPAAQPRGHDSGPPLLRQRHAGFQTIGAAQVKQEFRRVRVCLQQCLIPGDGGLYRAKQSHMRGIGAFFRQAPQPAVGHRHKWRDRVGRVQGHGGIESQRGFLKAVGVHGVNPAPQLSFGSRELFNAGRASVVLPVDPSREAECQGQEDGAIPPGYFPA